MGHSILESMLTDEADIKLLESLSNDKLGKPELLNKLMNILSDDGAYIRHLEPSKAISLFRMAKEYFNSCWGLYLDNSLGGPKLDKLIEYSRTVVYWVDAPNGERVATEKEVENGVEQLKPKFTCAFKDNVESYLNILLWTLSGYLRYYKSAGLSYTYTDGKLDDTEYQLVCKAGKLIRELIDWVSIKGNYERALALLKVYKKNSKYKYPSFAADEITVNESTKQIMYICRTSIIGKGSTENQIEVKKTLTKIDKHNYKPTPFDIAVMRRAYTEIKNGYVENQVKELNQEIETLCKRIEIGLEEGLIEKKAFALKIVGTIRKTGRCSEKQKEILKEAEVKLSKQLVKMDLNKVKKDNKIMNESMDELLKMSDALGSGVLEV